ncbi:Multiple ankyrin repeats single kh domain [Mycena sanguinolenta]|uniref:Multiple ankyrin repeats single kh domain n=1 Tax=Mycena sanguinolenta TaxID=230812 RepID=A0A8H6YS95_9AGAR|nr:Multiple ankyrin repeats single kh domain [Mycena sanguinolenta]
MNNTNTFIYFLLYVQHKSQLGPQQIKSDLVSWFNHVRGWFFGSVSLGEPKIKLKPEERSDSASSLEAPTIEPRSLLGAIFRIKVRGVVAILGSLHLSMMAALGLWLWTEPRSFGTLTDANACAMQFSSAIIVGKRVPLSSSGLRIWSLLIYGVLLVPGLNLLWPMGFFLLLIKFYSAWHKPFEKREARRRAHRAARKCELSSAGSLLPAAPDPTMQMGLTKRARNLARRSLWALQIWYNPFLLPTVLGMVALFAINIIFIVDTEAMLRQNRRLEEPGEADWTFGQTLAMLLLVIPLRDLRVFGARRDVTGSLRNAVHWQAQTEILWDLVRRGADVNVEAEGSPYPTVLLLVVTRRRDVEFTKILLASGANPDIPDSTNCTALQTACSQGNLEIVKLLLQHGANPNIEGGQHGTALQAAAISGNPEIVKLLLEHGADPTIQGGQYGTALRRQRPAYSTQK